VEDSGTTDSSPTGGLEEEVEVAIREERFPSAPERPRRDVDMLKKIPFETDGSGLDAPPTYYYIYIHLW